MIRALVSGGLLFLIIACTPGRELIKSSTAFSKRVFPGNIPVDEKGNPLEVPAQRIYFIYVETTIGKKPEFDSALVDGKHYKVIVSMITENEIEAGQILNSEKVQKIKARPGNQLWKLDLDPSAAYHSPVTGSRIFLKGKEKGKNFRLRIKKVIELEPEIVG